VANYVDGAMALRLLRLLALVAVLAAAAGCGTPSHLDAQEQTAFARQCTSLLERNVANDPDRSDRSLKLDGSTFDLESGAAFYAGLERLRGPNTFDLSNSASSNTTRNAAFDRCKNDAFDSRNRTPGVVPSSSRSTTTTTTTTMPTPN
jgi:hypothetical protein